MEHSHQASFALPASRPTPTLAELTARLTTFHQASTLIRVEGQKIADDLQRTLEGSHPDLHMIRHLMSHIDLDLVEVDWCLRRLLGKA